MKKIIGLFIISGLLAACSDVPRFLKTPEPAGSFEVVEDEALEVGSIRDAATLVASFRETEHLDVYLAALDETRVQDIITIPNDAHNEIQTIVYFTSSRVVIVSDSANRVIRIVEDTTTNYTLAEKKQALFDAENRVLSMEEGEERETQIKELLTAWNSLLKEEGQDYEMTLAEYKTILTESTRP